MKYLTVIRHAKSSREQTDIDDIARPLNDRGKKAIKLVGAYLKDQRLNPDLIISSPATRALQTAIGIGELVGFKKQNIQISKQIYFQDTTAILKLIHKIDGKYKNVFLFGHEPKLSSLIHKLTGLDLEGFPTCSAYRMSFEVKNWADIKAKSGKCEFFVNPKLLGEK